MFQFGRYFLRNRHVTKLYPGILETIVMDKYYSAGNKIFLPFFFAVIQHNLWLPTNWLIDCSTTYFFCKFLDNDVVGLAVFAQSVVRSSKFCTCHVINMFRILAWCLYYYIKFSLGYINFKDPFLYQVEHII